MVSLTAEDKQKFKTELKNLNPVEVLTVATFIEKSSLSTADKKFCNTHIGMRCEKLLRNVANNISFED